MPKRLLKMVWTRPLWTTARVSLHSRPPQTTVRVSFDETRRIEGVKLEEQVLVTETGCIVLSRFPFEDSLLG